MKWSIVLCLLLFSACNGVDIMGGGPLPSAASEVDEIMLIMDDEDFQNTAAGNFLQSILLEPYPQLPQGEPRFSMHQVPAYDFMPLLKQASTIVYAADLSKAGGTASAVKSAISRASIDPAKIPYFVIRNSWARPQNVVYFFGKNQEELEERLRKHQNELLTLIYELEDIKALNNAYAGGVNDGLSSQLLSAAEVNMKIPLSFRAVEIENDLASVVEWYREDLGEVVNNVMVTTLSYDLVKNKDLVQVGRKLHERVGSLVQSQQEGSYMTTDTINFDRSETPIRLDERNAILARGLWIMTKDYMGGPFLYLLIDQPEKERYVLLEAFVYAPGEKKRKLMRRMEQMLLNVEL